jgi:hypothetical protein
LTIPGDVANILAPGERLLVAFHSSRIFGPRFIFPAHVFATDERVIFRLPGLIRRDYEDYRYEDISNVRFHKGIFVGNIEFRVRFLSDPFIITGVNNGEAQAFVRAVQLGVRRRFYGTFGPIAGEIMQPPQPRQHWWNQLLEYSE